MSADLYPSPGPWYGDYLAVSFRLILRAPWHKTAQRHAGELKQRAGFYYYIMIQLAPQDHTALAL